VKGDTRRSYAELIQDAVENVVAQLDEALDLEALAGRAGLSPFHFHRVFRGMTGETPLELARRLRLERAAWRLSRSADPVTDIAFDAGYETHEAFTRAFKAAFSTSPSGFRDRKYRRTVLPATCGIHHRAEGGAVPPFIPRDSGGQHMQVEIVEMPVLRVAALRHVGPYSQISQTFSKLSQIAGLAGLVRNDAAMVALYHDDPESVPQDRLRSDAGIIVPAGAQIPATLTEQTLPAARYAKTVHRGPYEQLGDAWARFLGEWLPSSGQRLASTPSFELYRNTPLDTPKEQLITELYAPLA
jgi:AraC family transcriptional regulator